MVEFKKETLEKMSDDALREILEWTKGYAEYGLSIEWFLLGILVGLCGNIFSSFLFDVIKTYVPKYWVQIEGLLGIGSFIVLVYFSYRWLKIYNKARAGFKALGTKRLIEEVMRRRDLTTDDNHMA